MEHSNEAWEGEWPDSFLFPKKISIPISSGKRYLVIGGLPYKSYTGTGTFTGLRVIAYVDDLELAKEQVRQNYEDCSGLIICVDVETGIVIAG